MNIRAQTKVLVTKEKHYTALILKNLAVIERDKLYSDYGYPSLFKYLVRELAYSEGEANIRVAAVKLVTRRQSVVKDIQKGELSLTGAALVQSSLAQHEKETGKKASGEMVGQAVGLALGESTRKTRDKLRDQLKLQTPRTEKLILDERILAKMDRARKIYGEISAYELLDTLLEEKLKSPNIPLRRYRNSTPKNSRYIPADVKHDVHTGQCKKCGERRNLHYDHIKEFSKGGTNGADNIQILCENCNQRKRIAARLC